MKRAMIYGSLLIAGLTLLPAGAIAQTASTTCAQTGAFTNCNTTTMPAPYAFAQAADDDVSPLDMAMARKQRRKAKATKLLGAGDCPGATKAAFGTGDMDFIGKVRAYCSSPAEG